MKMKNLCKFIVLGILITSMCSCDKETQFKLIIKIKDNYSLRQSIPFSNQYFTALDISQIGLLIPINSDQSFSTFNNILSPFKISYLFEENLDIIKNLQLKVNDRSCLGYTNFFNYLLIESKINLSKNEMNAVILLLNKIKFVEFIELYHTSTEWKQSSATNTLDCNSSTTLSRSSTNCSNVKFIDVEGGWLHTLSGEYNVLPSQISERSRSIPTGDIIHGTGTLGITIGSNRRKFSGIASGANTYLVSKYNNDASLDIYNALIIAMNNATNDAKNKNGNVILLEMQIAGISSCNYPLESDAPLFRLIRATTYCLNTIIIEPAANNATGINLDTCMVTNPYSTGTVKIPFGSIDSGAIIISATNYGCNDKIPSFYRKTDVNYGNRVDSFVWGQNIISTSAISPTGSILYQSFDNTSGASAIMAGISVYIQSTYKTKYPLSYIKPNQMRLLLKNNIIGTGPFKMPKLSIPTNPYFLSAKIDTIYSINALRGSGLVNSICN